MTGRALILAAWLLIRCADAAQAGEASLAVVIDDLGYSLVRAERVMALPAPVTLAVLPFAPETPAILDLARRTGHEIILHQPMEALPQSRGASIPGLLTVDMPAGHFESLMDAALRAVPGIVGVNNHTGSRLTQDHAAMRRLMGLLKGRDLLFLDSRTTPATVAYAMAREARIPAIERDVFLDHVPRRDAIHREFQRALAIARRDGHAVLIAHPYAVSLDYLEEALAALPPDVAVTSLRRLTDRDPVTLARHGSPESPRRSPGQ